MTKRKALKKESPRKKFSINNYGKEYIIGEQISDKDRGTSYSHVLGTTIPGKFKIKHNGPKDGTYATRTETLATFPMQERIPFEDKVATIAKDLGALVVAKNTAYGNAFEKSREILKVLYPNGLFPNQYRNALAITRIADKLCRIATDESAFGEEPWKDIAGYALRALAEK